MQHFSIDEIKSWDRFYRANFINSLQGFKPVSLIATVNEQGQNNVAIFSNIVHIGADPVLIGFINRPVEAAPHTIENIKQTGEYTINHINPNFVAAAHQTSAKYEQGEDEFEKVGLTAVFKAGSNAPFVKESAVQYALKLVEIVPIKHNNTFLVIGRLTAVFLQENILLPDGYINVEKAKSITSLGIDAYYTTDFIGRFKYAKPDTELKEISS